MKKTTSTFKKIFLTLGIIFMNLIFTNKANATVTITKPNLSITTCSGFPTSYSALGNIVITEGVNSDFTAGTNVTLILTAPTNFEFQASTGSVTFASGNNISAATITSITATAITITYSSSSTNRTDVMTISGLYVRATNIAGTGNITRTLGTGIISGLIATTTLTNTLTSTSGSAIPTINTQPVATSVCTTGTTTLSVTATGATSYQWRKGGVALTNVAPYSNVTTATLTIATPAVGDAGNFDVVINTSPCSITSSSVALTVNPLPTAAITPSPATTATGICYGGTGPLTSVSWAAVSGATSYDVYFGAGSLPGTVTSNVGTATTYSIGTLLASTTYYWKVVAKNACGDATGSSTWTFTTASSPCVVYCTPTASSGVDGTGITNVSYSSVNYTTSNTTVYNDYTAQTGSVVQGAAMPISVTISVGKTNYNIKVWVDWNNDGDFTDSGEEMLSGNDSKNLIGTFTIPAAAIVGNHRMRVGITQGQGAGAKYETATPCFTGVKGAFEDYILNVTAATCTTAIPTVTTSPASVSIANNANTSFTGVFANTPTSYLWEVSSDGGTNYTPITNGGVYTTATTATLTLTAANYGMNGFKYRVSASNACGTSSLSSVATLTVTAPGYCDVSSSTAPTTYYISNFESTGNLLDTANLSNSYSTNGYGDFTAIKIATQIPGGAANFSINVLPFGTTFDQKQRVSCFVDWNSDGVFADPSERVYSSNGISILETTFGFTVPQTTNPGNYRMRVRTRRPTVADGVAVAPCTLYTTGGETEDYTIAVVQDCSSKILSVTNGSQCGNNTVTLGAVGLGGTTQYKWYSASSGGTLLATTSTGTWTTPSLTATTVYYVTAFNGSCESLVRTRVVATIVPTTTIVFSPTNPTTCGEDNVITINAAGDTTVIDLFNEDFEGTTYGLTGTITGAGGAASPWAVKTNPDDSSTIIWKPTISSGSIGTKFALTSSDYGGANLVTRYTTTNIINTTDFIDLTLTFRHYFSYYPAPTINYANVQVSYDVGNTTWFNVGVTYGSDTGVASKFVDAIIDLTPFVGKTNLKFRFEYTANYADGWAIDDIRLFGTKQLYTTFTWSAATPVAAFTDYACNTPYVAQKVNVIYLKPDLSQLETSTFPITVNATLGNGCPVSQIITVTNNSKVWRGDVVGTTDTTAEWNDPNNWKPYGVPTSSNCVIAPENTIISGTNYNAYAKNIVVKNGGSFEVQAGNNITVADWIKVETGGTFNVRNNASIIQTNDDANIGTVNIQRITQPMNYYDYTYWNSPVTSASNFTLGSLSPGSTYMYSWTPTISNGKGNWQSVATSASIVPNKGYIVRAPNSFSTSSKVTYTGTFAGTPNNGPISTPISKGTFIGTVGVDAEDDEWNLIGNPYPSGINATTFLNLPANAAVIEGTIYVWTHITAPSSAAPDPFYGDYVLNYTDNDYAVFNTTGGTATAASSSGGTAPTGYIATGQSFFVKAATAMTNGTTANVTFNNSMRASGKNTDFFRTIDKKAPTKGQTNRIWLNLTNNSGAFSQTLIGYVAGATQGLDRNYDGESFGGNDVTFYSIIPQGNLTIQGRALPFVDTDVVNLGFNAVKAGSYSIRIDHLDGVLTKQNVYLEDKLLNVTTELKKKPYVFTTAKGTFDGRFVLRYSEASKTLGTENFDLSNAVNVITKDKVTVKSTNQVIKNITVFDLLGQKIDTYSNVNSNELTLNHLSKTTSALIVKITLDDDAVVSKKIIF